MGTAYDRVPTKYSDDPNAEEAAGLTVISPAPRTADRRTTWFLQFCIFPLLAFIAGCVLTTMFWRFVPLPGKYSYNLECDIKSYGFLTTERGQNIVEEMTNLAQTDSMVSALRYMQAQMQEDSDVWDACHQLLHHFGASAWKLPRIEALETQRDGYHALILEEFMGTPHEDMLRICHAAYLHSVLEQGLKDFHSSAEDPWSDSYPETFKAEVKWLGETICDELADIEPHEGRKMTRNFVECHHGLGHGITLDRHRRNRRQEVLDSLAVCDELGFGEGCTTGVWMDVWIRLGHTWELDLTDPNVHPLEEVCADMPKTPSCKGFLPMAYLMHRPGDLAGAMDLCNRYDDPDEGTNFCYQGIGYELGNEYKESLVPLEQTCLLATRTEAKWDCFERGITYVRNSLHKHGKGSIPSYLCDNLAFFKSKCLESAADPDVPIESFFSLGDGTP